MPFNIMYGVENTKLHAHAAAVRRVQTPHNLPQHLRADM